MGANATICPHDEGNEAHRTHMRFENSCSNQLLMMRCMPTCRLPLVSWCWPLSFARSPARISSQYNSKGTVVVLSMCTSRRLCFWSSVGAFASARLLFALGTLSAGLSGAPYPAHIHTNLESRGVKSIPGILD
mmetsp:Transcript_126410/g.300159  ORF Transcript_126410/g.300159 Transcript_126410/m.300159 type:complete len:133 (-) Transcript_126410:53-451(-)